MDWTEIISNNVFPIIVALWFMLRLEKVLVRVIETMTRANILLGIVAEKNGIDIDS